MEKLLQITDILNTLNRITKGLIGAEKTEEEKTTQTLLIREKTKHVKARQHCSKRIFPDEDIKNGELGYYYKHDKDSPHNSCSKCSTAFTTGDKVFLTNYFHQYDIITPFPYCRNCIQDLLVAKKL